MKPPTISEDGEAEAAAEAGAETPHNHHDDGLATTDSEVAEWVKNAMERKMNGLMGKSEKPALHAVSMDAMPVGAGVEETAGTVPPSTQDT